MSTTNHCAYTIIIYTRCLCWRRPIMDFCTQPSRQHQYGKAVPQSQCVKADSTQLYLQGYTFISLRKNVKCLICVDMNQCFIWVLRQQNNQGQWFITFRRQSMTVQHDGALQQLQGRKIYQKIAYEKITESQTCATHSCQLTFLRPKLGAFYLLEISKWVIER